MKLFDYLKIIFMKEKVNFELDRKIIYMKPFKLDEIREK